MSTVYIYKRNDKIKVIDSETPKEIHLAMAGNKWKHISTLNASVTLERILNASGLDDLIDTIEYYKGK